MNPHSVRSVPKNVFLNCSQNEFEVKSSMNPHSIEVFLEMCSAYSTQPTLKGLGTARPEVADR